MARFKSMRHIYRSTSSFEKESTLKNKLCCHIASPSASRYLNHFNLSITERYSPRLVIKLTVIAPFTTNRLFCCGADDLQCYYMFHLSVDEINKRAFHAVVFARHVIYIGLLVLFNVRPPCDLQFFLNSLELLRYTLVTIEGFTYLVSKIIFRCSRTSRKSLIPTAFEVTSQYVLRIEVITISHTGSNLAAIATYHVSIAAMIATCSALIFSARSLIVNPSSLMFSPCKQIKPVASSRCSGTPYR